ncbi:hypothetical protein E4U39_004609 [Claviceps sp. Clav50 group G5]|nr:hypothetical protein E4U39_004609 [Claviceps sp. Clav50 group G5]
MSTYKLAEEKAVDVKPADEKLRIQKFRLPESFKIKSIICNQLAASPSSMIDRCLTEPILRGIDHLRLKTEI